MSRVALAAASALLIALAACGDDGSDAVSPTRAPSAPTPSPTGSAAPSTPPTPDLPSPLPAGADVGQVTDAATAALGPTDSVVAELSRFVHLPTDIPTPQGSYLLQFDVGIGYSFFKDEEAEDFGAAEAILFASNSMVFETTSSPDDVATFYEAEMAAAGYPLLASREEAEENQIPQLVREFAFPDSTFKWDRVAVTIYVEPGVSTEVKLDVNHRASADSLARIDAWPSELPGAPDVSAERISLSAGRQVVRGTTDVLDLSAHYRVADTLTDDEIPDGQINELHRTMRSALPSDTFERRRPPADPADEPCFAPYRGHVIPVRAEGFRIIQLGVGVGVETRPTELDNAVEERTFLAVEVCGQVDLPEAHASTPSSGADGSG